MKRSNLLSKAEMKNVLGGGVPLVALCDHGQVPGGGGIAYEDCMRCCAAQHGCEYCDLTQGSICKVMEEPHPKPWT